MTQKQLNLLTEDIASRVLNRSTNIEDIVETLRSHWEYDLEDRRPGPAILADGGVKPTDLDLACLLATLAKRKAVVILPKYHQAGTRKSGTANQQLISGDNRRGQLQRLSAGTEYFSMNINIMDQNVINTDDGSLGSPRTFHVLGKDGKFHPGWDTIQFVANAPENDFISKYGLDVAGRIPFDRFVDEGRWVSFFGKYYFLTKLVIQRLEDEAKLIRAQVKELKSKLPSTTKSSGYTPPEEGEEKFGTRSVDVPVFEAQVDAPVVGDFDLVRTYGPTTSKDLDIMSKELKSREYALNDLRFATRATELAYYKANGRAGGVERAGTPSWLRGKSFSDHLIKRTTWRRMADADLLSGFGKDAALRYRIRSKRIEVAV